MTPHHTGTHFLRLLLELHYAVDYVVLQDQLLPEGQWVEKWGAHSPFHPSPEFLEFIREDHPTNLYCTGRLELDGYENAISSNRRSYNKK